MPVDYLPFYDAKDPEASTQRTLDVLHTLLRRYPQQHAAACFELVQGEAGYYSAPQKFFEKVMQLLKEQQIAIISDEVQCFGRTTQLFAFQHFGLQAYVDIVCIGKLSQVCATLFTQAYKPRPGLLSQTFTSSSAAIKAAQVIIEGLLSGGYFGDQGKIARLSRYFMGSLQQLAEKHPDKLRDPFGVGSMIAFTPYDGQTDEVLKFAHRLFEAGVIGFIAGTHPMRVRFLMPVGAIDEADIDRVVEVIKSVL